MGYSRKEIPLTAPQHGILMQGLGQHCHPANEHDKKERAFPTVLVESSSSLLLDRLQYDRMNHQFTGSGVAKQMGKEDSDGRWISPSLQEPVRRLRVGFNQLRQPRPNL
jgi:hypothetical protein